jgi:acyl-CoA synthetase (AMP-forming)/AMP-acid ligase II
MLFADFDALPDGGLSGLLDAVAEHAPGLQLHDDAGPFAVDGLAQRVELLAGGLEGWGVAPGDRVGIFMSNRREWLETWFAVARVGAVLVPLNTRFTLAEIQYVLQHGGVRWLLWRPGDGKLDAAALAQLEQDGLELRGRAVLDGTPAAPHEVAYDHLLAEGGFTPVREDGLGPGMIQYTSGSTAFPKGAVLRNAGLVRNGYGLGRAWRLTPADRLIVSNPLFHCGGSVFSFMAGFTHATGLVLTARWRLEEALDLMDRLGITVAPVIDAAARDLIAHARAGGRRPASLRLLSTAADRELFERAHAALACEVSNVYGLTECSPNVCVGDLADPLETRLAHIGRPQPGLEVAIRDPETGAPCPLGTTGEILVRGGVSVMLGYYGDEEATDRVFTADGFLHTGDLGSLDADGYLDYRGRAKLMIKSGGENIAIEEVEEVLRAHAALADAVVVPIPHERFGEVGFAYLRRHGDQDVDVDDVLRFCREHLAGFKVPKQATVVDDLPRTGSGKVDRSALTARAVEETTITAP